MSNDTKFIEGLIFKPPHENAPEYVKAKGSIKRRELINWLEQQEGDWVNFEVKAGRSGKWYSAVDDWKPNGQGGQQRQESRRQSAPPAPTFTDDDLNF